MAAVTEMVGQTNAKERSHASATDADTAFANFISLNVRNLPKRLKFSCQSEINQVLGIQQQSILWYTTK